MSSIVADYGDSDSDGSNDDQSDECGPKSLLFTESNAKEDDESRGTVSAKANEQDRRPLPSFSDSRAPSNSVFANPFRMVEDAESASLERHVKLTDVPGKLRQINGRKVCWNYRKGKCRFGANCTFAHDSELQRTSGSHTEDAEAASVTGGSSDTPAPVLPSSGEKRKKRPGLGDSLRPGKRVMKMYQIENGQLT